MSPHQLSSPTTGLHSWYALAPPTLAERISGVEQVKHLVERPQELNGPLRSCEFRKTWVVVTVCDSYARANDLCCEVHLHLLFSPVHVGLP